MTDVLARLKVRHARTEHGDCGECHRTWPCRTWRDLETVEERDAREAAEQAAADAYERDVFARIRDAVTGEDCYDMVERMGSAIIAALELHPPTGTGYDATVRAIARELLIDVPDA